jgi:hypothetical protein
MRTRALLRCLPPAPLKDERVLRAQQQSSEGKQKREGVEHRITELEQ